MANHSTSAEMQMCINDCFDCHSTCLETIAYCLHKGGQYADESHICLLQDCAELCQVGGNFMLRGSDFNGQVCELGALICESCADECDRFEDDLQMKACAETCRRCADSCLQMTRA
jgi:hypothetical protein